ncbi:MAG: hypothetical protein ACK5MK_08520 [Dysgonomonas sp.]
MDRSKEAKQQLKRILTDAVNSLSTNYKGSSLTDIFLIVDPESGEIEVFDDEENCIIKEIVNAWEDQDLIDDDDVCNTAYARDLREVVAEMDNEDLFSSLNVFTPFSINLADENFAVQEELLLIEDASVIRVEKEFMQRLDKEFDDFLDKLLKE